MSKQYKKIFISDYPELIKEFDFKKNSELIPHNISKGSNKKIWWICKKCKFSFKALVNNRTSSNSGCPACAGKVVSTKNSLSINFPKLTKEWSSKNKEDINNFSYGSDKKIWWVCKDCKYEYKSAISKRVAGRGCPSCGGKVVTPKNRFSTLYPELLKEIHPTRNKEFFPSKYSYGSHKVIWWICEKKHEWKAPIKRRTNGSGCPHCKPHTSRAELRIYSELKGLFKDVTNREKLKGIEIDIFVPCIKLGIEYDGAFWHKDKTKNDYSKKNQLKKLGIKLIRIREVPLKKIEDYDLEVNPGDLTFDDMKSIIKSISSCIINKKIKKKLDNYLKQNDFIEKKNYKKYLSYLPGPEPNKSLKFLKPEVSKLWDYERNNPLKPEMFHPFSIKEVNWVCNKNKQHKWKSPISRLSSGHMCPFCVGRKILRSDSFANRYPKLFKDFNIKKNINIDPYKLSYGSTKKVWWKCSKCNYEWLAQITTRTRGHGCPNCKAIKAGKSVYCPELKLSFNSASQAQRELSKLGYKACENCIRMVCRGKNKTHIGLTFKYN